jgi:hypothetical protein
MKRLIIIAMVTMVGIIGTIVISSLCVILIEWSKGFHPPSEFETTAFTLRYARDYWISHGRPANFRLEEVIPSEDFFAYTNILRTTNSVFHCRFGSRNPGWPPGVVAITDEGQVIFVCSTNGKVTISPDKYGVYP